MNKLKTILFAVFMGVFFVSLPVFAAVDDFEVSPSSGLFNEANLAPGDSVSRNLTLKNNTSYLQTVRFKITNYKDGIVLIPFVSRPSLGDKIYIEIKDGASTLFAKDTMSNFKSQEVTLNLPANSSKVLTFNAFFDGLADNDYQGSSLSFDFLFEARWNGPTGEEIEGEIVPGTTGGAATTRTGRVALAGGGGSIISGAAFLGNPSDVDAEDIEDENLSEETPSPTPEVLGEDKEKEGFFDKVLAKIGDILPPLCLDKTSLIWLIIGLLIGYGGEHFLNTKIRNRRNSAMAAGFMSFFWSECSFWWLIIGIIVGYFIADLLRRKRQKKPEEDPTI